MDRPSSSVGLSTLRSEPFTFLREVSAQGDLVRVRGAPFPVFVANHPDVIRHILLDNYTNYHKASAASRVRPLFGDGLTTTDGERWHEHRRALLPLFRPRCLQSFSLAVEAVAAEAAETWRDRAIDARPIDIGAEMLRFTRRIILRVLFGGQDTSTEENLKDLTAAMDDALQEVNSRIWSPMLLPSWIPTPGHRRLRRALRTLHAFVQSRTHLSPAARQEPISWLDMLLAREPSFSMTEVHDETLTLLFAGHTTAAAALAWVWLLLDTHPDAERLCVTELRHLPTERPISAADLPAIPHARQLMSEVLRLYPPTWITGRTAVASDRLGGCRIPEGALVLISPWAVHRHPSFWPEPERFNPERFARPERDRHTYAYLPFGGGPRRCIGEGFAMMEMLILLATLARRYRVQPVSSTPVVPEPAIVLRPPSGTLVRIEHRRYDVPADGTMPDTSRRGEAQRN